MDYCGNVLLAFALSKVQDAFVCTICCVFTIFFSLKLLLSHINRLHSRSPDFRLLCGIDGCTEEYLVYNSFYYHVKRRHSQHLLESTRPADGIQAGGQPLEESQAATSKYLAKIVTWSVSPYDKSMGT